MTKKNSVASKPASKQSTALKVADAYLTVMRLGITVENDDVPDEAIIDRVNEALKELGITLAWVTQRDASSSGTQPTR